MGAVVGAAVDVVGPLVGASLVGAVVGALVGALLVVVGDDDGAYVTVGVPVLGAVVPSVGTSVGATETAVGTRVGDVVGAPLAPVGVLVPVGSRRTSMLPTESNTTPTPSVTLPVPLEYTSMWLPELIVTPAPSVAGAASIDMSAPESTLQFVPSVMPPVGARRTRLLVELRLQLLPIDSAPP